MYSKVKIMGHPVHPMLVNFPIAFYVSTLIAFIIYSIFGDPFWFWVGLAANFAGVAMAFVAATFGFIDWTFGIPYGSAAKDTGAKHMLLNIVSLLLFITCLILNAGQWNAILPVARGIVILPLFGVILTIGAGYFGWTLVQNHHVGVEFSPDEERCISESRSAGFTRDTV
ncbi:conserved membrane hypothetical protein [Syntrophobacter sp. SbD1]|nr:conserved membrane hypothetical protein [Syntrophobacter sp. SbD1]